MCRMPGWPPPAGWARPPVGGSGPDVHHLAFLWLLCRIGRYSTATLFKFRILLGHPRLRWRSATGEGGNSLKIPVIGGPVTWQDLPAPARLQQAVSRSPSAPWRCCPGEHTAGSSSRYRGISSLASSTQVLPFILSNT